LKAQISKTHNNAEVATLQFSTHAEHSIATQVSENNKTEKLPRTLAEDSNTIILNQFVFGGTQHSDKYHDEVLLQGDANKEGSIYSTQVCALTGLDPKPIMHNGINVGFIYEDMAYRICRLTGIVPQNIEASRTEQTSATFELLNDILQQNGFKFTDTIRTWIYLDRLLEWYDDFNVVRTAFFEKNGVFDAMVPAGTGIGAANKFGAAIMMNLIALQPLQNSPEIKPAISVVKSPLQNPALDYKSSFSRAVEIEYPTHRKLLISGTASIDSQGYTVYLNDPEKQIRMTMKVVHAILTSRNMDWEDLFRGIAYFKNMDYKPIYEKVAAELGIPNFPLAISCADVCRHDLLFEIEVDAVKLKS